MSENEFDGSKEGSGELVGPTQVELNDFVMRSGYFPSLEKQGFILDNPTLFHDQLVALRNMAKKQSPELPGKLRAFKNFVDKESRKRRGAATIN